MKYYIVTGRIPGDDEDTSMDVGRQRNAADAIELFREEMHDGTDDDTREDLRKEHGTDIFVNSVVSSDTEMEIEAS